MAAIVEVVTDSRFNADEEQLFWRLASGYPELTPELIEQAKRSKNLQTGLATKNAFDRLLNKEVGEQ
jgi:hypothetical protein